MKRKFDCDNTNDFMHEIEKVYKAKKLVNPTALQCMLQIANLAENSKLSGKFMKVVMPTIKQLMAKIDVNENQAILLSVIAENSSNNGAGTNDIAAFLNCRNMEMLQFSSDLDNLVHRKFIFGDSRFNSLVYFLTKRFLASLKSDKKMEEERYTNLTIDEFLSKENFLFIKKKNGDISYEFLLSELDFLIENNQHLKYVKCLKRLHLDDIDRMLLMFFCNDAIMYDSECTTMMDFNGLFRDSLMESSVKMSLKHGLNKLMEQFELVKYYGKESFMSKESFELTDKAKSELLSECELVKDKSSNDLIKYDTITEKKLFYNDDNKAQIDKLAALLSEEKFAQVRKRLKENGMRSGFACLFYGSPGTGKTETALQLARMTGRSILQINLAEMKSKWVGDSEKNVKAIFDRYNRLVNNMDKAPILLLNEADGLIGKRLVGAENAVDKMENTVQNIILQEIETLEGILIATTNLTQNLDSAFERRFIYKIQFQKPELTVRKDIWMSMMNGLNEHEAMTLAKEYTFSGGQIENIARRQAVDLIIEGKKPCFDKLLEYCDSETIEKDQRTKIGF